MGPLEAAVACLGRCKIVISPGGQSDTSKDHSWNLGPIGGGMVLPHGLCFRASMKYRFVTHEMGWRVTTLEYIYSLSVADEQVWAMHWHPVSSSPEVRPHLHIAIPRAGDKHEHRPVPRMTFEDAVEWVITSGAKATTEHWSDILRGSKDLHVQYRTWHDKGGTS